jgi:hypothetical protein
MPDGHALPTICNHHDFDYLTHPSILDTGILYTLKSSLTVLNQLKADVKSCRHHIIYKEIRNQ